MDAVVQFAGAVFVCLTAGVVNAAIVKRACARIYNRQLDH